MIWDVLIDDVPKIGECCVSGCCREPSRRYRVTGGFSVHVGLCPDHHDVLRRVPITCSVRRVSVDDWIVGEVMGS